MIAVEHLDELTKASDRSALAAALSDVQGPFDRPEWWSALAGHCALSPCYILAREGDQALLLPLARSGGTIGALANWYTFRWRPLASLGADRPALLAAAARALPRLGWRITLDQLPHEDAAELQAALKRAGWLVRCEAHDSNHVLSLAGRDYAAFLASRPSRLLNTLKRKAGKVSCEICSTFDPVAWGDYEAIYAASWKPAEGSPAFLRAFAEAEGAAGRLRLGIARIGGRAVAAQLWTVEAGTAWIHKLAHCEDAKACSPGSVLSAALFEHVIERDGVAVIDFGTGDDPYKRDWMDDIRPRYRIAALWPRSPRSWAHLAGALARRAVHR